MQLDKILQSQGFGSRKHCQSLIKCGHVKVHEQLVTDVKTNFKIDQLEFKVFDERYTFREQVYIALYKPQGYECSHHPQQHHSVYSLLPDYLIARNIQSVGRLDQDTTGLLLLTDDGKYLHALTHPRKHVAKYYQIKTIDPIDAEQQQALMQGVELKNENGVFVATDFQLISKDQCSFAVHQGVYHQIKRMLAAVGNRVSRLHRLQVGSLSLKELEIEEGQWCYLTDSQYLAALNDPNHQMKQ